MGHMLDERPQRRGSLASLVSNEDKLDHKFFSDMQEGKAQRRGSLSSLVSNEEQYVPSSSLSQFQVEEKYSVERQEVQSSSADTSHLSYNLLPDTHPTDDGNNIVSSYVKIDDQCPTSNCRDHSDYWSDSKFSEMIYDKEYLSSFQVTETFSSFTSFNKHLEVFFEEKKFKTIKKKKKKKKKK